MSGEISSKYPGIRYRKHATRKYGVMFDRYLIIRHTANGKRVNEGVGWLSEGWTEKRAAEILAGLNRNKRTGKEPKTLKEKRAIEETEKKVRKKSEIEEKHEQDRLTVSFKEFFDDVFLPDMKTRVKPDTWGKSKSHVEVWIDPVTGSLPMRFVSLDHVQKIKSNLAGVKRSPRHMQYIFRTFSMVWDAALDAGLVDKQSPTKSKSFKLPKVDNEKQRYLTVDEEMRLLDAVKMRGETAYHMAILSFDTGMRFKEIANLTWGCVDLDGETIKVLDSKGRDRFVPMTARVKTLFESMEIGNGRDLLFPAKGGRVQYQVPSSFKRGVVDAKLNDGIDDRKLKASFHTLRHTYASRLVQSGADLYRVQRLLGYSTPVMTARYSKLADNDLREAVGKMEERSRIQREKKRGAKVIRLRRVK